MRSDLYVTMNWNIRTEILSKSAGAFVIISGSVSMDYCREEFEIQVSKD